MGTLGSFSRIGRLAVPLLFIALLQLCLFQAAEARPRPVTPHVFPPNSTPYGHTYGEWSAIWWQSLLGNPFDPTAHSVGQLGHVVFLNSPPGPATQYTYELPVGTALLLTVGSAAFWVPDDFPEGTPIEVLRVTAASVVDLVTVAECSIDGVPVEDVFGYRTISPVFYGYLHPDNPWGYPEHPYGPAVADGFWIVIGPLSVGPHEVYFHSIVGDPNAPLFEAEATHNITVVPGVPGMNGVAAGVEPSTWGAIKGIYR